MDLFSYPVNKIMIQYRNRNFNFLEYIESFDMYTHPHTHIFKGKIIILLVT